MTPDISEEFSSPRKTSSLNRLISSLNQLDILWLVLIPLIISIGLMIGLFSIIRLFDLTSTGFTIAQDLIFSIGTFIISLSGLAQVWRRELYAPLVSVKGILPVAIGSLWTLLFWGLGGFFLFHAISLVR
jgi:hypothetical protein